MTAPVEGGLITRFVRKGLRYRERHYEGLSDLGTNAEPALTLLVERLNDSSESTDVQRSCATALGKIGKEPERVVPALAASLSNTEVRVPAMKALYLFGTNATGAIPALLPLLQDPNTNLAGAARRVLGIIDPEKWKPVFGKGHAQFKSVR